MARAIRQRQVCSRFGGLHIEMAALKSIGTLLQLSDWTSAIEEPDIAPSGTADSVLSASRVTRTDHNKLSV